MSRRTSAQMGTNAPSVRPAASAATVRNYGSAPKPGTSALPVGHEMRIERVDGGAIVETRKIGDYSSPTARKLVTEAELARMLPKERS